jgi:cyclopropane-fatty-acyl-phospholipid synthase
MTAMRGGPLVRSARAALLSRLERIEAGAITWVEDGERRVFGCPTDALPGAATLEIRDPHFYTYALRRGSVGLAEAWMDGWWTSDDLTGLVRVMARNPRVWGRIERPGLRWSAPLLRAYHAVRRNTRGGSRRNIGAHYDLGNEFFELFLDPTLTYSCAVFEREGMTLEEAQVAKYDRLCRKLDLRPGDRVLEIGTGWGGFAIHAAGRYGCQVTTTTISERQYELARKRVAKAGLADRVNVIKKDYRDLEGTYDKLVSIEMIEAVGHQYLDGFFHKCAELLAPDGAMALQAITVPDRRFEEHVRSVDFIKRYIFPGGCLVSVKRICEGIARATDLNLFHLEDITPHYATTLHTWRENLLKHVDRIRALGYADRFVRMWQFYLQYCEGGFAERVIGDVQVVLTKPLCRRPSIVPNLAS